MERGGDVARHFEDAAEMLAALDLESTWAAATELERRVLLDEFLGDITVLPDYIDVNIHGAPPIHVLYQEIGLKESEFSGVGGLSGNVGPDPSWWKVVGQSCRTSHEPLPNRGRNPERWSPRLPSSGQVTVTRPSLRVKTVATPSTESSPMSATRRPARSGPRGRSVKAAIRTSAK